MEANAKRARLLSLRTAVVLGTIATAIVSGACSSDESAKEEEKGPPAGDLSIEPVASSTEAAMPVDATPSPDGSEVYFIATTRRADPDGLGFERLPAVFKVSAKGGPITKLHEGAPLSAPFGITVSDDGQTLFLADASADTSDERSDGKVFVMSAAGGVPRALPGTEGLAPGGVEVHGDALYVTGKKDGRAGLFRIGLGGGDLAPLAVGGAFVDPSGVAVARSGDAYVVDSGSATQAQALASVMKVSPDGRAEVLLEGLVVGHPGGIALTSDDRTLLVSGLDPGKGTDVVTKVDLAGGEVTEITRTIGDFYESAGLHRARSTNVFAWADSHANGNGTVYVLGNR
jgi:sugar lactone lactonase YvrE